MVGIEPSSTRVLIVAQLGHPLKKTSHRGDWGDRGLTMVVTLAAFRFWPYPTGENLSHLLCSGSR